MDDQQLAQLSERLRRWLVDNSGNADPDVRVRSDLDGKELVLEDRSGRKAVIGVWFEPEVAYLSIGRIWSEEIPLAPHADESFDPIKTRLLLLLNASLTEVGVESSSDFYGTATLSRPHSPPQHRSHRPAFRRMLAGASDTSTSYEPYLVDGPN